MPIRMSNPHVGRGRPPAVVAGSPRPIPALGQARFVDGPLGSSGGSACRERLVPVVDRAIKKHGDLSLLRFVGYRRIDSFTGYVPRRLKGATEEWRRLHVLNYEMEAATVLTVTAAMGLRGGCITGVVVNRAISEHVTPEGLAAGEHGTVVPCPSW